MADLQSTALADEPRADILDLADELRAGGFDLLAPMRVSWYNDYILKLGLSTDSTGYLEEAGEQHASGEAAPFKLSPLPDYGRRGNALAFLVGNSRALWPIFLRWLRRQPEPRPNPLDMYSEMLIGGAAARFATSAGAPAHEAFWASDMTPARLVDMNRAARVCALTYFSDEMFLSIHPKFGSWVAFRAVLVFDLPADHLGAQPPAALPPLLTDEEAAAAKAAFDAALKASSEVELSVDGMPTHLAQKWAAMRDCVGRGREHKYDRLQSEYHYVKDASLLVEAMAQLPSDES
jgi:methylmalonic aciduria homocystinuria type C protein